MKLALTAAMLVVAIAASAQAASTTSAAATNTYNEISPDGRKLADAVIKPGMDFAAYCAKPADQKKAETVVIVQEKVRAKEIPQPMASSAVTDALKYAVAVCTSN